MKTSILAFGEHYFAELVDHFGVVAVDTTFWRGHDFG